MRVACPIALTDEEREYLKLLSEDDSTPQRLLLRARIILLADLGKANNQIAEELQTDPHTVGRWRNRFSTHRLEGLRRQSSLMLGNRTSKQHEISRLILEKTTSEPPRNGSRWTLRTLAAELGVSRSTVHRVWQAAGLKPHHNRSRELNLS